MALILFAISVVLYSTEPVLINIEPEREQMFVHFDKGFITWKILVPIFGLFTSFVGYKTTARLSIVFKVIRRYRNKHDIPKLP